MLMLDMGGAGSYLARVTCAIGAAVLLGMFLSAQEPPPPQGPIVEVRELAGPRQIVIDINRVKDRDTSIVLQGSAQNAIEVQELAARGVERHEIDPFQFPAHLANDVQLRFETRGREDRIVTLGEIRRWLNARSPNPPSKKRTGSREP